MLDKSSIVSVVITNHNGKDYLSSCLRSMETQTYQPLEVIVVDNASGDGSPDIAEKEFPGVIVIRNTINRYFGAANNQGIKASKGEFILCLNNDIVLEKNFIKFLVEKSNFDRRIGMWGGKLLREDGETIDSAGQFLGRNRKPVERGYLKKDIGQFDKEEYVFGVCAAAVLLRRDMLEAIKVGQEYFDEDFGTFYEDLDLCWRASRFAWRAYYVPQALAFHKRGGSAQTAEPKSGLLKKFAITHLSAELQANLVRNRILTIIKNDTVKEFIKNIVFVISYDIMLVVYIILFRPKVILLLYKSKDMFKKSFQKRNYIRDKLAGRESR